MGKEIERKFLTTSGKFKQLAEPQRYHQGYLSSKKNCTVRVRTIATKAYLTIKGPSQGATRTEFEYEIPHGDAKELLDELCEKPTIEKDRYKVNYEGFVWEVDVFFGENEGLCVAEIELTAEDQAFAKPDWIGKEVTHDVRYFNSNLITYPYCNW